MVQMEKQIATKIIPNFSFKSTRIAAASALEGDLTAVLDAFDMGMAHFEGNVELTFLAFSNNFFLSE